MSETNDSTTERTTADTEEHLADQREEIGEVQEKLDAEAEGDGLAAEAGSGEEMGLSEG